jgi:2-oxoglutarate ferredoxin oxidoreductase subunit delta
MKKGDFQVSIRDDWCKSCGICSTFCPGDVLTVRPGEKAMVVNQAACTGCGLCERLCPDLAILVLPLGATA